MIKVYILNKYQNENYNLWLIQWLLIVKWLLFWLNQFESIFWDVNRIN